MDDVLTIFEVPEGFCPAIDNSKECKRIKYQVVVFNGVEVTCISHLTTIGPFVGKYQKVYDERNQFFYLE